ncbi:hypothetical protein A3711_12795 [Erythrobacter sp. HI00D59]|nr:hypothetical protein A3711_12795 [Erythrobacter sp. HI00D59]
MIRPIACAALACALPLAIVPPAAIAHPDRSHRSMLDEGKPIARDWQATDRFDAVTLTGSDEMAVRHGERWQIRASGDPEILADLRFVIENGALTVGRRWRRSPLPGSARIEVTAPDVNAVTLAGSGTLGADRLNGDRTAATVAGSGRLELDRLSAGHFAATIAGSGDLVASGNARNARISIAGSGAIEARGLRLNNASLTIAGSGDARLSANGRVSANIAGNGSAEVMGTTDCQQTRTGSGRLACSALSTVK